ncbi:MAG: cobalamin biosynthesis protein [Candidatus Omnitrophota bacterium]|nr:cobalamin biosynthesis protein [Candidatus Omnitrophota bacterium]
MKITSKLWIGIAILTVLSPIGLMLPEHFRAGSAWGEWGVEEMERLAGYIPQGLEKLAGLWIAPIPDYAFKGCAPLFIAIVGVGITALVAVGIGKLLVKKGD